MKSILNKLTAKAVSLAIILAGYSLLTLAQTSLAPSCSCSTDMYVIADPGGFKIRCNQTLFFDLGTNITITPQNICSPANCLTQWAINVYDAKTGTNIKGGKGQGNAANLGVTLNTKAGFRVELDGSCNGNKCHCQFWIKPRPH